MKKSRDIKILITGGRGFIGSHFIRYLRAQYAHVRIINLDKLTYAASRRTLGDIPHDRRYTFRRGDICDPACVRDAMRGCQWVVNFAAETHVDRAIADAKPFIKTNIDGVRVLMEYASRYKVERFLQVSTDEVYGSRATGSFRESDVLQPNNPYAASKAAADLCVRSYGVTYHLPAVIVRPSNNFGPFQYPEKIIPLFITHILAGRPVPLYGDGRNIRDWMFVEDTCRAIDCVLHHGREHEIYNVAAGNEMTNRVLTRQLLTAMGKDSSWIRRVPDRPGHDFRYSLDCTKIRGLGFEPRARFHAALRSTIEWYRKNRAWWKPFKRRS